MEFISLYGMYIKKFFKARLEYRTSFILGIISNLYCYFITYVSFWVIVKKFGSIGGWSYEEMCILYGVNLLSYSMAGMIFWAVLGLEKEVTAGSLDTYLTKPMGILRQIVCKNFTDTFIGQFVIALIFMIIAAGRQNIEMNAWKLVYSIYAVAGGFLIHSAAMIFFGTLSFWMKRSLPLADLLYFDVRSFIQYPLSIFPAVIRIALTFILPWALINYYPSLIILDKFHSKYEFCLGAAAPLIGGLLFCGSVRFFYFGLKKYDGSGT